MTRYQFAQSQGKLDQLSELNKLIHAEYGTLEFEKWREWGILVISRDKLRFQGKTYSYLSVAQFINDNV